jgi:hypothetical protein
MEAMGKSAQGLVYGSLEGERMKLRDYYERNRSAMDDGAAESLRALAYHPQVANEAEARKLLAQMRAAAEALCI